MTWQGDVVSLVEAFRSGERSPVAEAEAALAAIGASDLNAFSFVDAEGALERAATADVSLPLGGVPIGVKELHQVEGWPDTDASLLFAERYADHDTTMVARLRPAGANLMGLT
ncbi:MAG: amidase family protein, partial [Acidimicrobiales bacterium]|nr:amidase family protein [Acidimicrobiales bacterium]